MAKIVEPDDWRRQGQEKYLKGMRMVKQSYRPCREGWDHDHCEFCGKKFAASPDRLTEGFSSDNGYHWVCLDCYKDFREEYEWS